MSGAKTPSLAYDKGDRRFKHVGRGPDPYIEFDDSHPRKWVGKCPDNIPDATKLKVLNAAIPAPQGDLEASYPRRLYAVYQGAIYEARTSDCGRSYHAYPYKGKMSDALVEGLALMATAEGTTKVFMAWLKTHITTGAQR